jgi:hypothetical protein
MVNHHFYFSLVYFLQKIYVKKNSAKETCLSPPLHPMVEGGRLLKPAVNKKI